MTAKASPIQLTDVLRAEYTRDFEECELRVPHAGEPATPVTGATSSHAPSLASQSRVRAMR